MTQASLLRPTRKTDAKYLRDQVNLAEGYKDDAETAAGTATGQAVIATQQNTLATAAKNQAEAHELAAEAAAGQAQAVTVSGDVSYDPAANQVPIARSNGKIDPHWIQSAAYPGNAVDTAGAVTGALIPDNTQYAFTPAMARLFDVFIPETLTREIIVYEDGVQGIYITTDRKIRLNCYGVYETTARLSVYGDYVTIQLDRNDNQADTVTVYFMVNGVLFDTVKVSAFSDLYVRNLLNSTSGFLLLVSPGHSTLTNAGVAKVENPGDAIGLLRDLSTNGVNFSQATATSRPLAGRVPSTGRRNLLDRTERLMDSVWQTTNVTKSQVEFKSTHGRNVFKLVATAVNGRHVLYRNVSSTLSAPYSYKFKAKADGYNFLTLTAFKGSNSAAVYYTFDLTTGATVQRLGAYGTLSAVATEVEGEEGWWECEIHWTNTGSNAIDNLLIGPSPSGTPATDIFWGTAEFTGDGVSGVLIREPQYESGLVSNDYQEVGLTNRDITESGIPDVWYAFFDGSDDILGGTVPAITNGTIVLAGTNGIWIDSLTVSAGLLNLGATGYTGGPVGALTLVGSLIGVFVINRAITTPERTALINYFKARGAPGVFELGAELVTNGTFDTNTTGWSAARGGTIAWNPSGAIDITSNSSLNGGNANQSFPTTAAVTYLLSVDCIEDGGEARVRIQTGSPELPGDGQLIQLIFVNDNTSARSFFTANASSTRILLTEQNLGNLTSTYDNVSIKPVTLNTGA